MKQELDSNVEIITPELAKEYLQKNVNNYRKLQRSRVYKYAADISRGLWRLNGEPIIFSEDGVLKDGQHRLAAIVYANKAVKMLVVRGVKKDVTVFNVGGMRTTNQILKASGIDLPTAAVAAGRIVVSMFGSAATGVEKEYIEKNNAELARAYRCTCNGSGKRAFSQKAACIAASYIMLKTASMPFYELELFFKVFCTKDTTGTDGYNASSVLIARKMFEDRFQKYSGTMAQKEQLEILVLAMQDFHAGKKREQAYKIKSPFSWEKLVRQVRKMDGLDD